ncbi:hypothetical protein O6H91_17G021700 [Diphasiastrum complanatum]|uniref:Uncharacterized protein n=1 Tax=Diphasiastrum complanatum TaxID=34168 RepID=A0ACC2B4S9_DIPCM|nr:hypothetical protein O6H91_17G021700 [Diphasiastrum complanatum]
MKSRETYGYVSLLLPGSIEGSPFESDIFSPSGEVSGPVMGGGLVMSGRESSSLREQDQLLTIANVGHFMKKDLPSNAKTSKDAKEYFITREVSDKCQHENQKSIIGDDLLWAMNTLGFENYMEPLKVYLQRYSEKVSMTN